MLTRAQWLDAAEQFRAAAERVRAGWCRGELARDEQGRAVGVASRAAVQWCAHGALWGRYSAWTALVSWAIPGLAGWNDSRQRTQGDVVLLLEWAAWRAEGEAIRC